MAGSGTVERGMLDVGPLRNAGVWGSATDLAACAGVLGSGTVECGMVEAWPLWNAGVAGSGTWLLRTAGVTGPETERVEFGAACGV